MSYKSILVCPSQRDNTKALAHVACDIARHTDSVRVIGAHWVPLFNEHRHGQRILGKIDQQANGPIFNRVREMSNEFLEIASSLDYPSQWVSITAEQDKDADVIVEYSRCCDLIVTQALGTGNTPSTLKTRLILESGKPVLVLPDKPSNSLTLEHALIAWNSTREASRAAFDSLPLLKNAKKREILWINEPDEADSIVHFRIKEFATGLVVHNINTIIDKINSTADDSNTIAGKILNRAEEVGADLIIAGAYGETFANQASLGNTTTELLMNARVPVLFSC